MIEISKLIEFLLAILGAMAIYEIGYTMHFEHLKSEFAKFDFPNNMPHFKFHFWRIGLFANPMIDPRNNFIGLCFPILKYEEHWIKVIGPLWWRSCTHEMNGFIVGEIDMSKLKNKEEEKK